MSEQEKELRIEGVVRASSYARDAPGKQFLRAIIECSDGKDWVIDYDEQSPFHAFADRHVLVSGEPYEPKGQQLAGRHFRVSTMRLAEVTPDAQLVEVGARQEISGRFERGTSDTREASLSFVTEKGDTFLVFNDPAGATLGRSVEVWAYPVQPSPSIPDLPSSISGSSAHVRPQIFGSGVDGGRDDHGFALRQLQRRGNSPKFCIDPTVAVATFRQGADLQRNRLLVWVETLAYRPGRNIFNCFRVWPKTPTQIRVWRLPVFRAIFE